MNKYLIQMSEAIRNSGSPDRGLTFDAWQRRAIITRDALSVIHDEYLGDVAGIREKYTPTFAKIEQEPIESNYNEVVQIAKDKVLEDLDKTVEAKRKQLSKCLDAPSDEDLRLLSVLRMRNSLTDGELATASEKLNGNLQSLRTLADIAADRDLYFPHVADAGELDEMLIRAEQFARESVESISTPVEQMSYLDRCFWTAPGTGPAVAYFEPVDNLRFTSPQEKRGLELVGDLGDPNAALVYCTGNESLPLIAIQFGVSTADIQTANPNLDCNHLRNGDELIVPSTRFKTSDAVGCVGIGQVVATYYTPANEQELVSRQYGQNR